MLAVRSRLSALRWLVFVSSLSCFTNFSSAISTKSAIAPDANASAGETNGGLQDQKSKPPGPNGLRSPDDNLILDPMVRKLTESHAVMFTIIFAVTGLVICG